MIKRVIIWYFVASALLMAALGLIVPYSLWWDELYSTTSSSLPVNSLFSEFVLNDVHPPLYGIVLHFWIKIFGTDERALRLLSFLFASASLILISLEFRKKLPAIPAFAAITFFSTSWLVPFYGQEVRSYSMLLFLSTLSTIFYWRNQTGVNTTVNFTSLLLSLFILSLVHYFGLIYAGVLLLFLIYSYRKSRKTIPIIITGLVCLVWPSIHMLYGNITSKTGGEFWIKSSGVYSTIGAFVSSIIPQVVLFPKALEKIWGDFLYSHYMVAGVLFMILISTIILLTKKTEGGQNQRGLVINIFGVIITFLVVLIAIDYHTPLSTARNYITLLPISALLFGLLIAQFGDKNPLSVILVVMIFGLSSQFYSALRVKNKITPIQNHKSAIAFIEDDLIPDDRSVYYYARHQEMKGMAYIQNLMAGFYFLNHRSPQPITYDELGNLTHPFVVLFQHNKFMPDEITQIYSDSKFTVKYFLPKQSSKTSVMILYSEE